MRGERTTRNTNMWHTVCVQQQIGIAVGDTFTTAALSLLLMLGLRL